MDKGLAVACRTMEYVSRLDLYKYYSLYGSMWKLILQSRTLSLCSKSSMKYLEEEPALQCRRQFARQTCRHWSLVQGLLRESWIRGCLDSRTIPSSRTPGLWRYKIEDSVPCPEGTFLGVEGKLGDTDVQISYHCNRLYVTLTLSGVYINGGF